MVPLPALSQCAPLWCDLRAYYHTRRAPLSHLTAESGRVPGARPAPMASTTRSESSWLGARGAQTPAKQRETLSGSSDNGRAPCAVEMVRAAEVHADPLPGSRLGLCPGCAPA